MCDPASAAIAVGTLVVANQLRPDLPELPAAPASPPKAVDPKVRAARSREQAQARSARGRSSTILTGSGGLTTPPSTTPKTLLGQ